MNPLDKLEIYDIKKNSKEFKNDIYYLGVKKKNNITILGELSSIDNKISYKNYNVCNINKIEKIENNNNCEFKYKKKNIIYNKLYFIKAENNLKYYENNYISVLSYNIHYESFKNHGEKMDSGLEKIRKLLPEHIDFIGLQEIAKNETDIDRIEKIFKNFKIIKITENEKIKITDNIIMVNKMYGEPSYSLKSLLYSSKNNDSINKIEFNNNKYKGRDYILLIFEKFKLCVINIHQGHNFSSNIMLNMKLILEELEADNEKYFNYLKTFFSKEGFRIILMGDFNRKTKNFYIFPTLFNKNYIKLYSSNYNSKKNKFNYKTTNHSDPYSYVDNIFCSIDEPICFKSFSKETIKTYYLEDDIINISDHYPNISLIKDNKKLNYKKKLNNKKAVFGFDGVLHSYIKLSDKDYYQNMISLKLDDDKYLNFPFVNVLTKLIDLHMEGYDIILIASLERESVPQTEKLILKNKIKKFLELYCPEIIKEVNILFSTKTTYEDDTEIWKKLKEIKPNVFVDNNYSNIKSILKEAININLDEIYITNPLNKDRKLKKNDLGFDFIIERFDIKLIQFKIAAFDFDGVIHNHVISHNKSDGPYENPPYYEQIHPKNFNFVNNPEFEGKDFFKVIEKLKLYYEDNYKIVIVTAQTYNQKNGILNILKLYNIKYTVDVRLMIFDDTTTDNINNNYPNYLIDKDKTIDNKNKKNDKIEKIKANVFFEDSWTNIKPLIKAIQANKLSYLKELYFCNPFNENRIFPPIIDGDTYFTNEITIKKKDILNIMPLIAK